jgi:poly-gamma-glutamate synthesis protein (capsule biosynthesis protein)
MAKVIRDADAALVNLELSLFRLSEFKGWPEVENGGNWELGPPEAAYDLKALGFDLYNRANNHTTDYGVEGMRLTNMLLDELGLVHAGSGSNLGDASRPRYLDTPKGRIAFIGLATTFTPMSRAADARGPVPGRPGINALRIETIYEADPVTFKRLRAAAAAFDGADAVDTGSDEIELLTQVVRRGTRTRTITTVNALDEARILREIRNATSMADYVVVTSHSHESTQAPPAWLSEFIKKCLDAGASTYVIHGPHLLRGIEIYKGKPIFYSLANFIFQNETIDPMPTDHYELFDLPETALAADLYNARFRNGTTGFPAEAEYYESVIAVPTFQGARLLELKLYPIDLGHKAPRSQRGTPRLADEAIGRKIIERMAKMSEPLGTTIAYENGIGVWKPSLTASKSQARRKKR